MSEDFTLEEFENVTKEFFGEKEPEGFVELHNKDGIIVWENANYRELFETKKFTKTQCTIPVDFDTMIKIHLFEGPDIMENHKDIPDFKVLDKGDNTDVFYVVLNVPIMFVSNRYSVERRRWKEVNKDTFLAVDKSIPFDQSKLPKGAKKCVLSRTMTVKLLERAGNGTKETQYIVNNFGGNVAKLEKLFGGSGEVVKEIKKEIEGCVKQAEKMKKREQAKT